MIKISMAVMRLLAIAIGTTLAAIYSLPLRAQLNQIKNNRFTRKNKYI